MSIAEPFLCACQSFDCIYLKDGDRMPLWHITNDAHLLWWAWHGLGIMPVLHCLLFWCIAPVSRPFWNRVHPHWCMRQKRPRHSSVSGFGIMPLASLLASCAFQASCASSALAYLRCVLFERPLTSVSRVVAVWWMIHTRVLMVMVMKLARSCHRGVSCSFRTLVRKGCNYSALPR